MGVRRHGGNVETGTGSLCGYDDSRSIQQDLVESVFSGSDWQYCNLDDRVGWQRRLISDGDCFLVGACVAEVDCGDSGDGLCVLRMEVGGCCVLSESVSRLHERFGYGVGGNLGDDSVDKSGSGDLLIVDAGLGSRRFRDA